MIVIIRAVIATITADSTVLLPADIILTKLRWSYENSKQTSSVHAAFPFAAQPLLARIETSRRTYARLILP